MAHDSELKMYKGVEVPGYITQDDDPLIFTVWKEGIDSVLHALEMDAVVLNEDTTPDEIEVSRQDIETIWLELHSNSETYLNSIRATQLADEGKGEMESNFEEYAFLYTQLGRIHQALFNIKFSMGESWRP